MYSVKIHIEVIDMSGYQLFVANTIEKSCDFNHKFKFRNFK